MTGRADVDSEADWGFEELYRAMLPAVHRFAVTRLGDAEGEDVTAEVFHAAAVAFTDGRQEAVTPAWIMAVARNKVIDRWRKASRRSAIGLRFLPRASDLTEFPPDWNEDPRREDVLCALNNLAESDRTLLVLHHLDAMTAPEIADALGISVSAVESRLARARRRFRSHYRPVAQGGER